MANRLGSQIPQLDLANLRGEPGIDDELVEDSEAAAGGGDQTGGGAVIAPILPPMLQRLITRPTLRGPDALCMTVCAVTERAALLDPNNTIRRNAPGIHGLSTALTGRGGTTPFRAPQS